MTKQRSFVVGTYVAGMIVGIPALCIAEVIQEEPLILKVEETGSCSKLNIADFVLDNVATPVFQSDDQHKIDIVLQEAVDNNNPFMCGLKSLGVKDGVVRIMHPA